MNTDFKNNLIRLETATSTNDEAFRLYNGQTRLAVVANEQTGGKGRLGRSFLSEKDKGIFLSLLETEVLAPDITAFAAVSVCTCLRELTGLPLVIKWPNDILVGGKKVCGILTEQKDGKVVIGIGINVSNEDFGELNEIATSLKLEGAEVDKDSLLDSLLASFDQMLNDYGSYRTDYINYYQSHCESIGCNIWLIKDNEKIPAHSTGIDENFGLKVVLTDGTKKTITSGEISIRKR